MSYRSFTVFLSYALMMSGTAAAITGLGAMLVREAAPALTPAVAEAAPVSRVEHGLRVQARAAARQPTAYRIEARALSSPDMPASKLADLMDTAERALPPPALPDPRPSPASKVSSVPDVSPTKPRVAGWIKRVRPNRHNEHVAESTARIIERSLKAEI